MGEADKKREELDEMIARYARETKAWAINNDCYKDSAGEIRGYFIVSPSPDKHNKKPVWQEQFNESGTTWLSVRDKLIEMGGLQTLAKDPLQGWYIGHRGEQGTVISAHCNYTFTSAQTARRLIDLVVSSGELNYALPHMKFNELIKDWSLRVIHEKLTEFITDEESPYQLSFGDLLLKATSTPDEPDS